MSEVPRFLARSQAGLVVALLLAGAATWLPACGPATPEPIDATHLAGRWELDTEGETEWFHLKPDGTFTCEIRGDGFLSTTMPSNPGVDRKGSWQLDGRMLAFTFDGAGGTAGVKAYRIVSLTNRNMVTEDADGTQRHELTKGL